MTGHRIYKISVASVYPHYIAKAEKKGRTKAEVDEIIRWLTGHTQQSMTNLKTRPVSRISSPGRPGSTRRGR